MMMSILTSHISFQSTYGRGRRWVWRGGWALVQHCWGEGGGGGSMGEKEVKYLLSQRQRGGAFLWHLWPVKLENNMTDVLDVINENFSWKIPNNWYTIDALGAIFTILDTFTKLLQYYDNTMTILLQYFYNTFTILLQYFYNTFTILISNFDFFHRYNVK